MLQYTSASPYAEHHLLYALRGSFDTGELEQAKSLRLHPVGRGPLRLALELIRYRRHEYDLVHLHSAWAGLLGRVILSVKRKPIVYSPHSYYFERVGLSAVARRIAWAVERLLAFNTTVVAALTPHEVDLAHRLGCRADWVPNEVKLPPGEALIVREPGARSGGHTQVPRIIAVGRISDQKDPSFFAATMAQLRQRNHEFAAIWFGDGDADLKARLVSAGVHVAGWLPRHELIVEMARSDVYVHTAAWEGSPMTLLEAHALRLPVVARSIPAPTALGYPPVRTSPAALAEAVTDVMAGASGDHPTVDRPDMAQALLHCYSRALRHKDPQKDPSIGMSTTHD